MLGVLFVWNKHDIPAHSYTYTQWWNLLCFLNNKAFMFVLVLVWIQTRLNLCWRLSSLCGSHALFTGSTSTDFSIKKIKIRSHNTIHTFKNYFAPVFSIFNFQQYFRNILDVCRSDCFPVVL